MTDTLITMTLLFITGGLGLVIGAISTFMVRSK